MAERNRSTFDRLTRVEKRAKRSEERLNKRLAAADTWGDQLTAVYDFVRSALVNSRLQTAPEDGARLIQLLRATGREVNNRAIAHARKEVRR